MKKSILLSVFMVFTLLLNAQRSQESVVEWLSSTEHDFGELELKKPVEVTFKYTNISSEPVIIDNIRTTCGCTAPHWSYNPILPGETSEILIVFDAKKVGYFRKKIKVYFDTQRSGEKLTIEGEVLPKDSF